MSEDTELIGLSVAAALVNVDASTLRRAAKARKLSAQKIGRDWLTTREAVLAWAKNENYHRTAPKKYRQRY